jgi:hypothetical protein
MGIDLDIRRRWVTEVVFLLEKGDSFPEVDGCCPHMDSSYLHMIGARMIDKRFW